MLNGPTIIICLMIIVIAIFGIRSYCRRLSSGCCGTGGANVKKIKVRDKQADHYPYVKKLKIYGMVCGNCANRVQNSLNSMEDVWAEVNLSEGSALVRMKKEISDDQLKKCVADSGYTVLSIEKM